MENGAKSLSSLFSLSREPVVGVQFGKILFMNPAAVSALGWDATGRPAGELLPEHMLRAQSQSFVCTAVVADRRAAVSAVTLEGVRVFMLTIQRSAQRKTEQRSSVSLQIRTALANVKLATDRMNSVCADSSDPRLEDCAMVLDHSYHELRRLLFNVSAADAIEKGELPLSTSVIDLAAKVRDLVELCAVFAGEKGIRLDFEPQIGSVPALVDEPLIEQLLLNLIVNSLQHVEKGGRIHVELAESVGSVVLSVDDNGCGIAPDVLSTVFCRWRQDMTLSEAASGAGVGLAVAKGIAEMHGGALIIESRVGKGTNVRVMLPTGVDCTEPFGFRAPTERYGSCGADTVLTYLSTWLGAEEYRRKYDD